MVNKYWDLTNFTFEKPITIIECYGVIAEA